jgi:hypothetical protein
MTSWSVLQYCTRQHGGRLNLNPDPVPRNRGRLGFSRGEAEDAAAPTVLLLPPTTGANIVCHHNSCCAASFELLMKRQVGKRHGTERQVQPPQIDLASAEPHAMMRGSLASIKAKRARGRLRDDKQWVIAR